VKGLGKSNVQVAGNGPSPDSCLPLNSEVVFYLNDTRLRFRDTITVRHARTGTLRVQSSSGSLRIHPLGCDAVEISLEDM
jgi:hypothetical protein